MSTYWSILGADVAPVLALKRGENLAALDAAETTLAAQAATANERKRIQVAAQDIRDHVRQVKPLAGEGVYHARLLRAMLEAQPDHLLAPCDIPLMALVDMNDVLAAQLTPEAMALFAKLVESPVLASHFVEGIFYGHLSNAEAATLRDALVGVDEDAMDNPELNDILNDFISGLDAVLGAGKDVWGSLV